MSVPPPLRAMRISAAEARRLEAAHDVVAQARTEAERVLQEARDLAAEMRAESKRALQEERRRALDAADASIRDFIERKRLEAGPEMVRQVIAEFRSVGTDFRMIEAWLPDLVVACVDRVVGRMAPDARLHAMVAQAAREQGARWRMNLIVAPEDHATVRDLVEQDAAFESLVEEVQARDGLVPGTCLISGGGGIVDITLSVQLRTLHSALCETIGAEV